MLGGALSLFLGALISDVAYYNTYEIQWQNFSSWLIVGGLFFSGFALVFAIVDAFRPVRRATGYFFYGVIVLATWLVAFFNALMHARDAWAAMPVGLWLSVVTVLLTGIATWLAFARPRVAVVAR